MTTTERIANAVAPIVAEATREYRDRIAELERDLNSAHALIANQKAHNLDLRATDEELRATIDDLNRQLDEAHKENARLILAHPHHAAPVVEEQGPWVVYAADNKVWKYGSVGGKAPICWYPAEGLIGSSSAQWFATKRDAEAANAQSAEKGRVITLAEARAIEAKRNG